MVVGRITPQVYVANLEAEEEPILPEIPREQPPTPLPAQYYIITQDDKKMVYLVAIVGIISLALVVVAIYRR